MTMTPCVAKRALPQWAGGTEPCGRDATWHVRFMGEWYAVCGRHRVAYDDLPLHRLGDRITCEGSPHE